MKILVLGADGMLGHQLVQSLSPRHQIAGSYRQPEQTYLPYIGFLPAEPYFGVDATSIASVENVLAAACPDAVINAVGIVKQRAESKDVIASLEINALLPHRLAVACGEVGARLVHLSTDCVFSGSAGMYTEGDFPDADDIYGRTKLLGEVSGAGCITLRTSIIGLELSRRKSLIEWFLAQKGQIKGFRKAIYSGFTTLEIARIIELVLTTHVGASGVYHVSSDPIDKYALLCRLRDRLGLDIEIVPDDMFRCDRSLQSERFRHDFAYTPPAWSVMIDELANQIRVRYP